MDLMFVGLKLMLLGMGIVFSFLVLLVFALKGMSKLAAWLAPETGAPAIAGAGRVQAVSAAHDDEELIAVISAAVTLFRTTHLKR